MRQVRSIYQKLGFACCCRLLIILVLLASTLAVPGTSMADVVDRNATIIKTDHYGLVNPLWNDTPASPMSYDPAQVDALGAAFSIDFVNPGGTGFKGYPSGTVGGFKTGGKWYPGDPLLTGMPIQIKDLGYDFKIQWEVSQLNANDADDKWWASINVIFDGGVELAEPVPADRDFDIVIEFERYAQEDLSDNPDGNTAYWWFARNPDGSIKPYVIEVAGMNYEFALRYKFFRNSGDKDNKVHLKYILIDNNNPPPYLDHSLKGFIDTGFDYVQYADLGAAEQTLASQKMNTNLWIKAVSAGYEVYEGVSTLVQNQLKTVFGAGVNQPPNFTGGDPMTEINAMDGMAYSSTLADDASDPESDPLSFLIIDGPLWLSITANGDLSGTPAPADVGLNSWTVLVADGNGGTDTTTLEITVDSSGSGGGGAGSNISIVSGPNTQSDDASGDTIFSGVSVQAGDVVAIATAPNKSTSINLQTLVWSGVEGVDGYSTTINPGDNNGRTCYLFYTEILNGGTYSFTVDAVDSAITSQSSLFVLRAGSGVIGVGDTATLNGNTANPGLSYSFSPETLLAGGSIAIESYAANSGSSLAEDAAYSPTYNAGGRHILYSTSLSGTSWDKTHASASGALNYVGAGAVFYEFVSSGGNTSPSFNSDPVVEVNATEGSAYSATLADNASDPDAGDVLNFSYTLKPSWLNIAFDGTLSGTPQNGDVGLNSATVTVSDGNGGNDSATLQITVEAAAPVNNPPVWNADPFNQTAATNGVAYVSYLNWRVTDAESDPLTFAIVSGPVWLSIGNPSIGKLEGTPGAGDVGVNVFVVSVSDGINPPIEATMNLEVVETGTPLDPPAAPSSLSAVAISKTQIDLSWADNADNETGFKIERSRRNNGNFAEIAMVGQDVISFSDTSVSKNTTYYYRVRAANSDGDSDYSNEANATTPRR
jgi:hypothetical protein